MGLLKENMLDTVGSRRDGSSFRERLKCVEDIEIIDLDNLWILYHLFMSYETAVNNWRRDNNSFASVVKCPSKITRQMSKGQSYPLSQNPMTLNLSLYD